MLLLLNHWNFHEFSSISSYFPCHLKNKTTFLGIPFHFYRSILCIYDNYDYFYRFFCYYLILLLLFLSLLLIFLNFNYLISIFSWRMFICKLPWTLSILSMNLPGIWWLVVVVMAPKISNNPQQPCCIKFLHEIGSSPLDMQQRYRILRAEICGFPMIYSPWPKHCAIILLSNNNLSLPFIKKMCNIRMKKTVGSILVGKKSIS